MSEPRRALGEAQTRGTVLRAARHGSSSSYQPTRFQIAMPIIDSAFAFCYRNFNRFAPTAKQLSDAVAQKRHNTSISASTVGKLQTIFNSTLLPGTYASVATTKQQIRIAETVVFNMRDSKAKRNLSSLMWAMEQRVNSEQERLDRNQRMTNALFPRGLALAQKVNGSRT